MKNENLSGIRVILLSGDEFQRSERLAGILDAAVDKATRDFNLDVFAPETFKLESVSELIITFPMMAERRVIVIRDFDSIHPETRKKAAAVIKNTPDTTLVVIEGEKAALSPKPPAKYFKAETFKTIYENGLPSWIQGRFVKRGKKASPDAVALLMNNVGTILRELDSEIEKVIVASPGKDSITKEDVSKVVGEFRHDTVWNLCNAVGLGDFDSALGILTNLMDSEKNRETFYVSTLATHILKIAEYNSLRRKGVSHGEALKVATTIPFLWKLNKMDAQTRNFGEHEVRRALTLLTDAELMLKKYSVDKRLMAEILIPLVTRRSGRQERVD